MAPVELEIALKEAAKLELAAQLATTKEATTRVALHMALVVRELHPTKIVLPPYNGPTDNLHPTPSRITFGPQHTQPLDSAASSQLREQSAAVSIQAAVQRHMLPHYNRRADDLHASPTRKSFGAPHTGPWGASASLQLREQPAAVSIQAAAQHERNAAHLAYQHNTVRQYWETLRVEAAANDHARSVLANQQRRREVIAASRITHQMKRWWRDQWPSRSARCELRAAIRIQAACRRHAARRAALRRRRRHVLEVALDRVRIQCVHYPPVGQPHSAAQQFRLNTASVIQERLDLARHPQQRELLHLTPAARRAWRLVLVGRCVREWLHTVSLSLSPVQWLAEHQLAQLRLGWTLWCVRTLLRSAALRRQKLGRRWRDRLQLRSAWKRWSGEAELLPTAGEERTHSKRRLRNRQLLLGWSSFLRARRPSRLLDYAITHVLTRAWRRLRHVLPTSIDPAAAVSVARLTLAWHLWRQQLSAATLIAVSAAVPGRIANERRRVALLRLATQAASGRSAREAWSKARRSRLASAVARWSSVHRSEYAARALWQGARSHFAMRTALGALASWACAAVRWRQFTARTAAATRLSRLLAVLRWRRRAGFATASLTPMHPFGLVGLRTLLRAWRLSCSLIRKTMSHLRASHASTCSLSLHHWLRAAKSMATRDELNRLAIRVLSRTGVQRWRLHAQRDSREQHTRVLRRQWCAFRRWLLRCAVAQRRRLEYERVASGEHRAFHKWHGRHSSRSSLRQRGWLVAQLHRLQQLHRAVFMWRALSQAVGPPEESRKPHVRMQAPSTHRSSHHESVVMCPRAVPISHEYRNLVTPLEHKPPIQKWQASQPAAARSVAFRAPAHSNHTRNYTMGGVNSSRAHSPLVYKSPIQKWQASQPAAARSIEGAFEATTGSDSSWSYAMECVKTSTPHGCHAMGCMKTSTHHTQAGTPDIGHSEPVAEWTKSLLHEREVSRRALERQAHAERHCALQLKINSQRDNERQQRITDRSRRPPTSPWLFNRPS